MCGNLGLSFAILITLTRPPRSTVLGPEYVAAEQANTIAFALGKLRLEGSVTSPDNTVTFARESNLEA